MNLFLPLYTSLFLGYGLYAAIVKEKQGLGFGLQLLLSAGLGLGVSSCIVFFSLIIWHQYNPVAIWCLHFALLTALFIYVHRNNKGPVTALKMNRQKIGIIAVKSAIALVLGYVIFIAAMRAPYGEWDGWALWNMKAKFIMLSGHAWQDLFNEAHNFTQPDYPLLLPCLLVWMSSLTGDLPFYIPLFTGVLFTLALSWLLYFGLCRFVKNSLAALAAGLLAFLPYCIRAGTSQYADVLLAFFLLSIFVALTIAVREEKEKFFIVSAALLGFMAFTKNEGISLAALIFLATTFFLFKNRPVHYKKYFKLFWIATALSMTAVIIFKLFLSPANRDILIRNMNPASQFFNLEGCYMVFSSFVKQFFHPSWGYVWLLMGFALFLNSRRYLYREAQIMTLTLIMFLLAVVLIYLATVNFSLMWRLSRTLPRILFYLYPSVLFLTFYIYGYKEKE